MRAEDSRGRRYPEAEHPYRSVYARDRDRIIHSRAFRRLEAKTQVFTTRYSDHFRNRLTHTLEVAQIARTVASALGLNTELAEALALVHDIGHPPFGHAGERKLDELMRAQGGSFNHNLHAHRSARAKLIFNGALKLVLDALATDLIETTGQRVLSSGASSADDIRRVPKRLAGFSDGAAAQNRELKRFLFAHIYNHSAIADD